MPIIDVEWDVTADGELFGRVPNQPGMTQRIADQAGVEAQRRLKLAKPIPIKIIGKVEQHVHPESDKITHTGHSHAH